VLSFTVILDGHNCPFGALSAAQPRSIAVNATNNMASAFMMGFAG
jgi:hypothetical protein